MQVPREEEAPPADHILPLYDTQHAWSPGSPAILKPAFLPGSPVAETHTDTEISSRPGVHEASSSRLLSLARTRFSHTPVGDAMSAAQDVTPLRGSFSLRGEMMHVFLSYRVGTEGDGGNGSNLSGLLAEGIRALSMDNMKPELQIPQQGWGIWPRAARKPVPFRKEEAKVFLDRECLQDGQSWLAGFVEGSNPHPTTSTPVGGLSASCASTLSPQPQPPKPKPT
jgi:hypothetical protein